MTRSDDSPRAVSTWPRLSRPLSESDIQFIPLSELRQRIAKIKREARARSSAGASPEPPADLSSGPSPDLPGAPPVRGSGHGRAVGHPEGDGLSAQRGLEAEWALHQLDEAREELEVVEEELKAQAEQIDDIRLAIEDERQRYRELFDFIPEPSLATDKSGKIVAANRAAAALLEVGNRSVLGRPIYSFVRPHDRPAFREQLDAVVAGGLTARWETTLGLPPVQPVLEVAVAVAAAPDNRGGLLWVLRDVSELRQHEARAQALSAELEQRVLDRTRELEASRRSLEETLAQERKARRLAEAAARDKGALIAAISHGLRSPIKLIVSWARAAESKPTAMALSLIERKASSMAKDLDDLLDHVRHERGVLDMSKASLRLDEMLSSLCQSLMPIAGARGLSLRLLDGQNLLIDGDHDRLERVFSTLLTSAMKFTPRGGAVSVRLGVEGHDAVVRVLDEGRSVVALPPSVGEPEGQGDDELTGLGLNLRLSIARRVVEAHGGVIEVTGEGSAFTVRLPLAG